MSDKKIVKCAEKIVAKLKEEKYYTIDGEFNPKVKKAIDHMRRICAED